MVDQFDLVVIGCSWGGLKAVSLLIAKLPADFSMPICLVMHLSPNHPSSLVDILDRRTALDVRWAGDGDQLAAGSLYVAPPNHHVDVRPNHRIELSLESREHYARPCIDRLFRTAATSLPGSVIGALLTGGGRDGTRGAGAIRSSGGCMLIQDPVEAEAPSMPDAAISSGAYDFVLTLKQMTGVLTSYASTEGAASFFLGR